MTCSWNDRSGASRIVRPSGATSPRGMTTGGPERQQPPPRHRRVAEHGQRELRVLVTERPQADGRAAVGPALRVEVPRDRRRCEIARTDAAPRFARLQAKYHHRFVREHAGASDDPAGVDRQPACRCRCPRRDRRIRREQPSRSEPIGFVPADPQHSCSRRPNAQRPCDQRVVSAPHVRHAQHSTASGCDEDDRHSESRFG